MQGRHRIGVVAALLLLLVGFTTAAAQEAETAPLGADALEANALRVYLDCGRCDTDYIRREIPFVTYVRLRQDSEVHLLVTDQASGAGGRQYQLHFIGQGQFASRVDTLVYDSPATDSEELRRRGLARTMKVGLLPFLSGTPQAAGIQISYAPPQVSAQRAGAGTVRRDPWNYWNFRASVNGNLQDEATRSSYRVNGSFSANRTTEQWKTNLSVYGQKNFTKIELTDRTVEDSNHNWSVDGLAVRSLTTHLSAGATSSVESSVFSNYDLAVRFAPAIEYNVFPYSESSRRALLFRYTAGVQRFNYYQETLFFKTSETLANHALDASYGVQQPWGGINISSQYSAYLHDAGLNRVQLDGSFDVNVMRGLSVNFGGSFERVRDQISLPRGELSDDEVLLNRRQRATGHRARLNVGMSYRFGSIYNNVVNTRFEERRGGMFR